MWLGKATGGWLYSLYNVVVRGIGEFQFVNSRFLTARKSQGTARRRFFCYNSYVHKYSHRVDGNPDERPCGHPHTVFSML